MSAWGGFGDGDGQFDRPGGLALDRSGHLFATDTSIGRIQKFSLDGTFLSKWVSMGKGNGQFFRPKGIAVDGGGNIYVTDTGNHRIQKFSSDGTFLAKWGSLGTGDGLFNSPEGVAADLYGNVYVADWGNYRIQKFTSDGTFLLKWAAAHTGGIAVDSAGDVYVGDNSSPPSAFVKKFTPTGELLTSWSVKVFGEEPYFGDGIAGVAVDSQGFVYVADSGMEVNAIKKFTSDGVFVKKWGGWGEGDSQFHGGPASIAVDASGNVYATDHHWVEYASYERIQKFSSDGAFLGKWVGTSGYSPGQANDVSGIATDSSGNVYITDCYNHRIQKLRPFSASVNTKAVIVAGGGAFPGNNLWDATQLSANFAYRALAYHGFTKGTIYYLSSDTDLDLDGNGIADDVNADAANANLQYALTQWAISQPNSMPTGDVVVYLVDHGGAGAFRMSGTETLPSTDLSAWLNTLQRNIVGKLIVVYDACESGTFLQDLVPPQRYEENRIVIASTSPGETANFVASGVVSFSNYFWTQVFNGLSVGEAFTEAAQALGESYAYQTPLLDDNGNGVGSDPGDGTIAGATFIGNGTQQFWERPEIGAVCDAQFIDNTAQATLWANPVIDSDGIARVWAVVRPPDYAQGSSDNPVAGLPSIDLLPVGADRYEATYEGFSTAGTYNILVYARDRIGNTSEAKMTTVTVSNPRSRKALIVAGGSTADPLWPAIESSTRVAYEALTFQGYHDADIYYLSRTTTPGVDALGALSNIDWAINTWAYTSTQDLTVCLVGPGVADSFAVSDTEDLSAAQLDAWLDSLQSVLPGKLAVVYDADMSGSFLPALIPPPDKSRMVVASAAADQSARFTLDGGVSFSTFFWTRVLNGATVFQAFSHAAEAMAVVGNGQAAQLDDNGDGAYSVTDGVLSRRYIIGSGILLAGDDPLIGSIVGEQTLSGGTSATLWADQVTTTGSIDAVYALIIPPGSGAKVEPAKSAGLTVTLQKVGPHRYELVWSGFWATGDYLISVYAVDAHGNLSMPKQTVVHQENGTGDTDGDGLRDDWETMDLDPNTPGIQNPFDPFNPDSSGDNFNPNPDGVPDGQNDWDGDGMTNASEFTFGFNPIDPMSFGEMPVTQWAALCLTLIALFGVAVKRLHSR